MKQGSSEEGCLFDCLQKPFDTDIPKDLYTRQKDYAIAIYQTAAAATTADLPQATTHAPNPHDLFGGLVYPTIIPNWKARQKVSSTKPVEPPRGMWSRCGFLPRTLFACVFTAWLFSFRPSRRVHGIGNLRCL
jgi:hypothetical protein